MRNLLLSLLMLTLAAPVVAGELVGVQMDDQMTVGEETLMLNGMGLRKKAIFKVYVAGIYLPAKASDPKAILDADSPRRMVMEFMRNVSASQLCDGWDEGLEANTPGASADLTAQFKTLCDAMDDVSKPDQVIFTYVPGSGTQIAVKGADKGIIEGKEFADALFACWIGDHPPGDDFKSGVLGQ